jgi:GT2 family glycosyltransferase
MGASETPAATCCAVVVNYRCAAATLACVASLRAHAPEVVIVVVENGSGDDSLQRLRAGLPEVGCCELLVAATNLGFGGGCNLGIAHALAGHRELRHVLLLNPDAVAMPGFLDELLATAARHPRAGIVGGTVVSLDGARVLYENGRYRPWTLTRSHVPAPRGQQEFPTTFVTGALMLIDAGLLRAGLRFDPAFFLYGEDLDLCCEVRARGRELWVNRRAVVRHAGGGSQHGDPAVLGALRRDQLYRLAESKVILARKRSTLLQRLVFFAVAFVAKPLAAVVLGKGLRFVPCYFAGLWAGLRAPLAQAAEDRVQAVADDQFHRCGDERIDDDHLRVHVRADQAGAAREAQRC